MCVLKTGRKRERGSPTERQPDRQRQRETETKTETERKTEKSRAGERKKDSDRDLGEAKLPTAFNLTKQKNRENKQQRKTISFSQCAFFILDFHNQAFAIFLPDS